MKLSLSAVGKEISELARSHFFPRFFLSLRRAEIGSKHPRTLNPRTCAPDRQTRFAGTVRGQTCLARPWCHAGAAWS